jgi:hypothetical protein
MYSPELSAQVAAWRQKAREGTLTQEEMKEAIKVLRVERAQASPTATSTKRTAAKAKPSGDDLLSQLEGI